MVIVRTILVVHKMSKRDLAYQDIGQKIKKKSKKIKDTMSASTTYINLKTSPTSSSHQR